jgi:hypothetical protein
MRYTNADMALILQIIKSRFFPDKLTFKLLQKHIVIVPPPKLKEILVHLAGSKCRVSSMFSL